VHECPDCGEACDCDGEDHWQSSPADCLHWTVCQYVSSDEDEYDPEQHLDPDDDEVSSGV